MRYKTLYFYVYPTKLQEEQMNSILFVNKVVWNKMLEENYTFFKNKKRWMNFREIKESMKKLPNDYKKVMEGFSDYYINETLSELNLKLKKYSSIPKVNRVEFLSFKKDDAQFSFFYNVFLGNHGIKDGHIDVPEVGTIKIKLDKPITGRVISTTFRKDDCARWICELRLVLDKSFQLTPQSFLTK